MAVMPNRPAAPSLNRRHKQAGRAIERIFGDRGQILYPDRGARPLRIFIRRYNDRPGGGYGSHFRGRHKLG